MHLGPGRRAESVEVAQLCDESDICLRFYIGQLVAQYVSRKDSVEKCTEIILGTIRYTVRILNRPKRSNDGRAIAQTSTTKILYEPHQF